MSALSAGLDHLGCEDRAGCLDLTSTVPRGRGYGSSTADVGSALYALGNALGQTLSPPEVARLAVSVEPSDSTIFPGLSLFAHRDASLHIPLTPTPPLAVVVLDPGGEVDTLTFNRLDHSDALRQLAPQHEEAIHLLMDGLERRNWEEIGAAATLSTRAHQAILTNPLLETALGLAEAVHALGVCRAHSGTVLGLLLDPRDVAVAGVLDFVRRSLPDAVSVAHYSLVGGGPRAVSAAEQPPAGAQHRSFSTWRRETSHEHSMTDVAVERNTDAA